MQEKAPSIVTLRVARRVLFGVLTALIVLLAVSLGVWRWQQPQSNSDNPQVLIAHLSKHIVLPNEDPVIATVTDRSKLTTPFLQQAHNGDKIFIYAKAKKVIIYRPSIDRIIDEGPVSLDTSGNVTQP